MDPCCLGVLHPGLRKTRNNKEKLTNPTLVVEVLISKLPMFLRHISPLTLVHWVPACQLWYVRLCICRHRLVCGAIGASTYPVAIRTYVPYPRCESHPTEDSSPGVQMWVGVLCEQRG